MPGVVSDTSPLRYLHQLGRFSCLHDCYETVHVPAAVAAELQRGAARGVSVPEPAGIPWCRLYPAQPESPALHQQLGSGERAAITLARGLQLPLLLDDLTARNQAAALGIKVTGTVGVLLRTKELGLLTALAPELDRLRLLGFRLSPKAAQRALQQAGEL